MNLLIPYIRLWDHEDPRLDEFTYGDIKTRGKKLRQLKKGDYLFFHTTLNGRKCITTYFVVDRALSTAEAAKDRNIKAKYKNPHISELLEKKLMYPDDNMVFGDPILSRKLNRPLFFNKKLADKLSLGIKFTKNRSESLTIGSATRSWRTLTDHDIKVLMNEAKTSEACGIEPDTILSTDEVAEIIEKDIENLIAASPKILGSNFKLIKRQYGTAVGIIDLIYEDKRGAKLIVELKLNKIGREALNQLRRYMDHIKKETRKPVKGIIVCKGVMPAFEEEFKKLKNIEILRYGWKFQIKPNK